MIAKHMRMGQSTISDYNKLLVWCGIIHIEEGHLTLNEPNEYYILDIPQVTDQSLAAIKSAVEVDMVRLATEREAKARQLEQGGLHKDANKVRNQRPGSFYSSLLKRLEQWQPIQSYWCESKERPAVTRPGQLALFPAPDGEHPAPDGEYPAPDPGAKQSITTIHNNNPHQQSTSTTSSPSHAPSLDDVVVTGILAWMGFDGKLNEKNKKPPLELLLAWGLWVKLHGQEAKNPVGVARSKWRLGEWPGNGLAAYAQKKVVDVVSAANGEGITVVLDLLADEFGQPSLENQIPAQYRGIIKT